MPTAMPSWITSLFGDSAMTTTTGDDQESGQQREMAAVKSASRSSALERRREKILEYADQALESKNVLLANLKLGGSDIMMMMMWLREDAERLRAELRDPVESLELSIPISEQFYKLFKQLQVFADFQLRISKTKQNSARAKRPEIKVISKKKQNPR